MSSDSISSLELSSKESLINALKCSRASMDFLKRQHCDTLTALHEEMIMLKDRCKSLQYHIAVLETGQSTNENQHHQPAKSSNDEVVDNLKTQIDMLSSSQSTAITKVAELEKMLQGRQKMIVMLTNRLLVANGRLNEYTQHKDEIPKVSPTHQQHRTHPLPPVRPPSRSGHIVQHTAAPISVEHLDSDDLSNLNHRILTLGSHGTNMLEDSLVLNYDGEDLVDVVSLSSTAPESTPSRPTSKKNNRTHRYTNPKTSAAPATGGQVVVPPIQKDVPRSNPQHHPV